MSIEPIGIVTLLVGLVCLFLGNGATVIGFSIFPVLGGAAALMFGGTGIQPGHLFLAFLAFSTFSYRDKMIAALDTLRRPSPAIWLALLVVYGILAGYFAPRLLANATAIVPIGTSPDPSSDGTVPLGPVSGNFTQAVYLIADVITFVLILSVASTREGVRNVAIGVSAFAGANVFFALIDMASPGTPLVGLLSYIRNAPYVFHDDEIVNGMRRVIGSWPEASAFAGVSLGAVGFTGTMWICGRNSLVNGLLFLASSVLVIRSTSSGGTAGLPICLAILYATSFFRAGGPSGTRASAILLLGVPVAVILFGFVLALDQALFKQLYDFVDLIVLSKSTSQSGIERSAWNAHGMANFFDSYGLGVGLGTSRTSSLAVAILSNVGLPGALFFGLFVLTAIVLPKGVVRTAPADIGIAARNGCLCLIIGDVISGTTVDLGLHFFIMAGLAYSAAKVSRAVAGGGALEATLSSSVQRASRVT